MSGLLLLFVFGLWVVFVTWLTKSLIRAMQPGLFKRIVHLMLFSMLLIVPVADDIVGGFQFRALCRQGYPPVYDEAKARDKTVKLKEVPVRILNQKPYLDIPRKYIDYTIIPIREDSWEYVDHITGETLLSWKEYHAKGGWLSRVTGFPQDSPPYTFNGVCSTHSNFPVLKKLNIKELGEK